MPESRLQWLSGPCETGAGLALAVTAPLADAHLSARVERTGNDTGSGLVARHSNGTGHLARIVPGAGVELVRRASNAEQVIARAAVAPPRPSFRRLAPRVGGHAPVRLEAFYEGASAFVHGDFAEDAPFAPGRVGLLSGSQDRTQFDYLTAPLKEQRCFRRFHNKGPTPSNGKPGLRRPAARVSYPNNSYVLSSLVLAQAWTS